MKLAHVSVALLLFLYAFSTPSNGDNTLDALERLLRRRLNEESKRAASESGSTNNERRASVSSADKPYLGAPLKIGAFNVQVFGTTKWSKEIVKNTLMEVIPRYDILLFQEIRDKSGEAIADLMTQLNQDGDEFDLVISERLGRSSSKEQYAYIYRKSKVQVVDTYQYPDTSDIFERPPYAAKFHSDLTELPDFSLIGIHTSPGDAVKEIDGLVDVYDEVKNHWNTEDIILLGDFNGDCTYVPKSQWENIRLWTDTRFKWHIDHGIDTTTKSTSCAYDRIVTGGDAMHSSVVWNSSLVYHFDRDMGLTSEQTQEVSDHYPVEFELLGLMNEDVPEYFETALPITVQNNQPYAVTVDVNFLLENSGSPNVANFVFKKQSDALLFANKKHVTDAITELTELKETCGILTQTSIDVVAAYLERGLPPKLPSIPGLPENSGDAYCIRIAYSSSLTEGTTYIIFVSRC